MHGLVFFLIVTLATPVMFAQDGTPFFTNFKLPGGFSPQNWGIAQDSDGTLLFANRRGILSFDGSDWEYLELNIIPYSISQDPFSGNIFVGSNNKFGYLIKNEYGEYRFVPLSVTESGYGAITKIAFCGSSVFFYSQSGIIIIDQEKPEDQQVVKPGSDELFAGFFIHDSTLFVNIWRKGIYTLNNGVLVPIPEGKILDNVSILFFLPYNNNSTLIATDNSFLYLFNGSDLHDYIIKDEDYIVNAVISGGIKLSENQIALATLTGGCIMVDTKTGQTKSMLNYQSGLPDDEIYAIAKDKDNGIWLTHESGATRIDLTLPVRNFNAYSGLEGNLSEIIYFENTIYVSTSEGVFYLHPVKKYKNIEILVKKREVKQESMLIPKLEGVTVGIEKGEEVKKKEPDTQTTQKRGASDFFSKLFKRDKSNQNKELIQADSLVQPKTPVLIPQGRTSIQNQSGQTSKPVYITKKYAQLESISYQFLKVKDLNAKCKQFTIFQGRLLVASNTGLYQIMNGKSEFVILNAYINHVYPSSVNPNRLYVGTETGLEIVNYLDGSFKVNHNYLTLQMPVYSVWEGNNILWLGSDTRAIKIGLENYSEPSIQKIFNIPTPYSEKVIVGEVSGVPAFFTTSGIFRYEVKTDELVKMYTSWYTDQEFLWCIFSQDNNIWIFKENNWATLTKRQEKEEQQTLFLRLIDDVRYLQTDEEKNLWVIDGNNQIFKILYTDSIPQKADINVFIEDISNREGERFDLYNLTLQSRLMPLQFSVTAPYYLRPDLTEFQYFIEGLDQPWSDWTNDHVKSIQYLPSGYYSFHVRARNVLGKISRERTVGFFINPPFTKTGLFYILVGIGILFILFLIILIRERKLLNDKKVLESKVTERTKKIARQKEEIEKQKDEISYQKQDITDSISYGRRIQKAIMPPVEALKDIMPEFFIFFKPRDIVSGDFYWIVEKDNKIIIAAVDCTGHGVPGAFMSFLGNSLLSEIRNNYRITTASIILNRLRKNLIIALHQTGREDETKDGMDMGLCVYDPEELTLQYAGAYNPLYIIRDGILQEIKGDRMPIGVHYKKEEPFTNHKLNLKKNDTFYLFTDGFIDQFGGSKDKKYKFIRFRELLLSIQDEEMIQQKRIIAKEFQKWKGDNNIQVDDVLIVGVRI